MQQIDHNPKESRPTNTIWWVLVAILAVNWIGYLYFNAADVWALAVGGGTGLIFALWAIEISGNKWPFSPPGRR